MSCWNAPAGWARRLAAATVVGGHERVLRQTVIALVQGTALGDHENPGEASVHVLAGRVRFVGWPGFLGGTAR